MNTNLSNVNSNSKRFVLTRKNQKGQVAVFVALIFQVIFVFFALLINVGLLVHHKINLQQSTDLAAYYGAMKQAEVLNTIAHVNFQVKQAYKLLTWRYRVLGTFGMISDQGPTDGITSQIFPIYNGVESKFLYNGKNNGAATQCEDPNGERYGIQDIPFFCIGHGGLANWPGGGENLCKVSCATLQGSAKTIGRIPGAGAVSIPGDAGTSRDLGTLLGIANTKLESLCNDLGPYTVATFTNFLAAYIADTNPRLRTIEALAKNLSSAEAKEILDIDGKTIFDGSKKTFENNLTEANRSGNVTYDIKTGLSQSSCRFEDGLDNKKEFLKKIEFDFLNYFIMNCKSAANFRYKPETLYSSDDPNKPLGPAFTANLSPDLQNLILSLVSNKGEKHTVGYEKNPNCVEYYSVKATSEPNIPFLPLKKIKLSAIAVAKPFGGTIGPWYGKTWPKGSSRSEDGGGGVDEDNKYDKNLPRRIFSGANGLESIRLSKTLQPNFSLYVGDQKGLADFDYLAANHAALAARDIKNIPTKNYASINPNNLRELGGFGTNIPTNAWPDTRNWTNLKDFGGSDPRSYDSLSGNTDIGTRYLEIAAIAPNQFDIANYSIDPDFYNNYYKRLYKSIEAIADKAQMSGSINANKLRPDFGAKSPNANDTNVAQPLEEKTFSVKDQILIKNIIFSASPTVKDTNGYPDKYNTVFKYLVSAQSSLLTGWTFLNYSDYDTFPNEDVNDKDKTMSFGQCFDSWNKTEDALNDIEKVDGFKTPMTVKSEYPPVPGNCVTGGRTGYSVKLINPDMITDPSKLDNALDPSFFSFP